MHMSEHTPLQSHHRLTRWAHQGVECQHNISLWSVQHRQHTRVCYPNLCILRTDSSNTPTQQQNTNTNNNSTGNNSSRATNPATFYSATPHQRSVSSQKHIKVINYMAQQQQSANKNSLSPVHYLTYGASHAAERLVVAVGAGQFVYAFKDSSEAFHHDKPIHSAAGSVHSGSVLCCDF